MQHEFTKNAPLVIKSKCRGSESVFLAHISTAVLNNREQHDVS